MKPFLILLLSVISAVSTSAQNQSGKPPFLLALSPEKLTANLDSDIWVKICWTNTSGQDLNANAYIQKATNLDLNYHLELRDGDGHLVPRKVYKFPQATLYDAVFGTLKPKDSITNEVNLRALYDLSRPSTYRLQVSRRIPKERGGGVIRSNVITITVTN